MIIGLYDEDLIRYGKTPFSLELMKLSAYFKGKNDLVKMTNSFLPDKYSEFYVAKDICDGAFLPNVYNYDNIHYLGRAFHPTQYKPLPMDIEQMPADNHLYDFMESRFGISEHDKKRFHQQSTAAHLRLSLDGTSVWDNWESQLRTNNNATSIMIHDYNIGKISGALDAVKTAYNYLIRQKKTIAWKYPLIVHHAEDILDWLKYPLYYQYCNWESAVFIEDAILQQIIDLLNTEHRKTAITYYITKEHFTEKDFIEKYLSKIYNQLIFCVINGQSFSLIYEDNFFINKEWEQVIAFMNYFSKNAARVLKPNNYSMVNICKTLAEIPLRTCKLGKQQAREMFLFVKDNCPELFDKFYRSEYNELC